MQLNQKQSSSSSASRTSFKHGIFSVALCLLTPFFASAASLPALADVTPFVSNVTTSIESFIDDASQLASSSVDASRIIAQEVGAVALNGVANTAQAFVRDASRTGDTFLTTFTLPLDFLTDAAIDYAHFTREVGQTVAQNITDAAHSSADLYRNVYTFTSAPVIDTTAALKQTLTDEIHTAKALTREGSIVLANTARDIVDTTRDTLSNLSFPTTDFNTLTSVTNPFKNVGATATTIAHSVADTTTRTFDTMSTAVSDTITSATSLSRTLATRASDTIASVTNSTRDTLAKLSNSALTITPNLALNTKNQTASIYGAVNEFWTDFLNTVFGPAETATTPPTQGLTAFPEAPTSPQIVTTPPRTGTTTITRVTQPVIERTIERTSVLSGVSATDLESQIAALRSELLNEIAKGKAVAVQDNNALYLAMAPMNRINNLSSVTLSSPTITNATVSSGSLSGTFSGSVTGTSGSFDTLGVGTTTPTGALAVNGVVYLAEVSAPSVTTNRLYNVGGNLYWGASVIGGSVGSWTLNGSDVTWTTGNVGIGTTSPYSMLSVAGQIVGQNFVATSTTATSTILGRLAVGRNQASANVNGTYFAGGLTSWLDNVGVDDVEIGLGRADNTTATAGSMIFGGRSRGTLSVPTVVQNGDNLLTLEAVGHDGTDFAKAALIGFDVDGTVAADTMPGRITFSTSPAGSQTPAERMRITSAGNVGIGTTSPYAKLSVVGEIVGSYFTATSTTATSTFTAGVNVGSGNGYYVNGARAVSGVTGSATSFGFSNTVSSSGLALGNSNTSSNASSVAVGISNTSSGVFSVATGYNNQATSTNASALGYFNNAGGTGAVAIGTSNNAYASQSVAIGRSITNTTANSLMIGPSDAAKLTILGATGSVGYVGIGTTSPYSMLSVAGQIVGQNFIATSTTATSTILGKLAVGYNQSSANVNGTYFTGGLTSWLDNVGVDDVEIGLGRADNTTATAGSMIFGGRSRGTLAAPTLVSNGDTLLTIQAVGHDGTDFAKSSAISFEADAATGANDMPGRIVFWTSPDGSQAPLERMRITNAGNLGIGTTSPYAKLSVVGQVVGSYFTATSTTATSSFAGGVSAGTGYGYWMGNANVLNTNATAVSTNTVGGAAGNLTVGIGNVATSSATPGIAIGISNIANDTLGGIAVGHSNTASAYLASAFGAGNIARGQEGVAFGRLNTTNGAYAVSFGHSNTSSMDNDIAVGRSNSVDGCGLVDCIGGALAFGTSNTVNADGASAFGTGITNTTDYSTMIGPSNAAKLTILSSGNVGIGTTSPYAKLSVVGEIVGRNFTATSTTATSTIAGGLDVGSGAFTYDYGAGLTSIQNLELGSLSFDTNAGVVSWMDMPVTASSTVGTIQSYSAQIDGNSLLTVYGESDGGGAIRNGAVGIGTTSPYSILSVSTASTTSTRPLFTVASSTGASLLTVGYDGNVGIGTAAPAKSLQVIGDIRVGTSGTNGCVENFAGTALTGTCSSDASLKTNIQPLGGVLSGLVQLTPSTFYWNDVAGNELHNSTTTQNYGLIAQDVARVLPSLVATTSNGYLGVNYSMLPILTLQGLKELNLNLEGLASTTAMMIDGAGEKTFAGRFFDRMTGWLADAANGISEFFANRIHTKTLCVGDSVEGETCITKSQLDTLLSGGSISNTAPVSVDTVAPSTPITISINGNNPATLNIGDRYGDLGALITAPESAKNFGVKASLDGGPALDISQITLDTSVAGSHTIVYSVIDQNNTTTTAERIVNVVAPTPVAIEPESTPTVVEAPEETSASTPEPESIPVSE